MWVLKTVSLREVRIGGGGGGGVGYALIKLCRTSSERA